MLQQNPELRKRFMGKPEYVENFMRFIAQELREYMAALGIRKVNDLIGRTDLLKIKDGEEEKAKHIDLSAILDASFAGERKENKFNPKNKFDFELEKTMDEKVFLPKLKTALETGEKAKISVNVTNLNRSLGTILGSEITKRFHEGLEADTITVECHGSGGQSFGAFIPKGLKLELIGDSNDYMGKGLSGGTIVVYPEKGSNFNANIINEGALRAVRMGRRVVSQADLEESVETVIAGYQKKNASVSENERRIVAYHEIGHALVAACQSNSAPVHKITIIPRTSGALGYTMQVEDGERLLMSKEEALNKIATLTGGRAAEEFMFHSITTGASNDIEQATKLARAMVTRYGMSDQFGMVALETVTNQYLGGDTSLACSPETAKAIDDEVIATVKAQYEKAVGILRDHAAKLNELAGYLLEKETITGEEFMEILNR